MKKLLFNVILFFFVSNNTQAQGVLPVHRYFSPITPFDLLQQAPSFGYSLRKLKNSYTGFAARLRRNTTGGPTADVAFDTANIVSASSLVTITSIGTGSGFTIGQIIPLSTFINGNRVFVSIWYNQGGGVNATQTTDANQPELILNSAGTGNTKSSISFDGSNDFLLMNEQIQNVVASGIRGSFLLAIKPGANNDHFTFGYRSLADWRWSFHINWSDGFCYFDAAETCCAGNRRFSNSSNINSWKQYSFVRGNTYKTARVSGQATALNNSAAASTAQTGGSFSIGSTTNNPNSTFTGNISELLMFPTDLSTVELNVIEQNQIAYWNL